MAFIAVTGLVLVLSLTIFNITIEVAGLFAIVSGLTAEMIERFDRIEDKLSKLLEEDDSE